MDTIMSSILGPLCQRVMDAVIDEYRLVRDVKEEISNLRTTIFMIKGVLHDAERKQVESDAIREWLKSLKQVLLDAEDVFDEIATDEALGITRDEVTMRLSKVRKLISCFRSVGHSSSNSRDIAHQVKDIKKQFDEISKSKDRLGLRVSDGNSCPKISKRSLDTSSLLHPNEAHLIGRDDEMKKIEDLLLDYSVEGTEAATTSDDKNSYVRVISVVGMGGIGKTTLVKHAYKSLAVTEYFQLKMWVCVSNDFDVERITREITDAVGSSSSEKTRDDQFSNNTSNWDAAQKRLQGKLEGKRFLLVLDDVWEEDSSKWDSLCTPLMYGGKGSKIIVTTRSRKVSNIAKVGTPIILKNLSNEYLWTIFQTYAFDGHDPDKHRQLVRVGKQIVEKLKGSPLAAKTIGRLLNSNLDAKHWTNIMKSEAWVSSDSEKSILPILKLSYDHVPGHLKQCFAYCSLFPEDHSFRKDELVQLWIAQQFIRTSEGSNLESEGGEYFDNLVYMSLFEKSTYSEEEYVMHDLIHNLAESVSEGDCFRMEANKQKGTILETVRHVSIASYRFDLLEIEQLCEYKNMRTLLFLYGCKFQMGPHLGNIFTRLRRLRILRLSGCGIKELPASIGALKHLRFLDLSANGIKELPESLCNLHNLQVLNLDYCGPINALPKRMSALINLRHLIVSDHGLVNGIEGLGKLTALRELGRFDCARQPMEALADMGMLRRLRICCLEEVKSKGVAIQSRLDKKEHLDDLTLQWSFGRDHDLINPGVEEEVLDGLQPPAGSIRRLSIRYYGGSRSPNWMEDRSSWVRDSCSLETLELVYCTKLRQLPPLPPTLVELRLQNVGLSGDLPGWSSCSSSSPPSLSSLEIRHCPDLTSLAGGLLKTYQLVKLVIEDCRGLVSLPETAFGHLTSLKELEVRGCPKLSWPSCESVEEEDTLPPSLERITIGGQIVGQAGTDRMMLAIIVCSQKLTCLRYLQIHGCCFSWPSRTTLVGEFVRLPSSLQELTIYRNYQLDDETLSALLRGLTSLTTINIQECPAVTSLPRAEVLSHLTSLKNLHIIFLKALKSFGGGVHSLPSLKRLFIRGCPELLDIITTAAADSSSPSSSAPLPRPAGMGTAPIIRTFHIEQSSVQQIKTWLLQCPSLQHLSIDSCPQLTGFGGGGGDDELEAALLNLSGTLKRLRFSYCENLRSLPPRLRCLSSLETLSIHHCPQIRSLPAAGLPESLRSLQIGRCPALKERCREGEGSNWPLVSHIPELDIA